MSASNQTLIEKADLALSEFTSGGGKLVEEQVKEFWRDAVLSSNFLQIVKTQPMKGTEFQIPKATMEEWVLVPGEERVALSEEDRSKATPKPEPYPTCRSSASMNTFATSKPLCCAIS